jgi:hypothetical protein
MNVGVIGMSVSFSELLPYDPNVKFFILVSVIVQVGALYLHVFNIWETMKSWKGSLGERLARDVGAAKKS